MPPTPALIQSRHDLARAASSLYTVVIETTTGTPERVDLVERFSSTCAILFGLYPVEVRQAVHTAATKRTGRPLSNDVHDHDVLAHMAAMIHELSALDTPEPAAPVALDAASATALAKATGIRFVASVLAVSYTLPPDKPSPRVYAALRHAVRALAQCYRPDEWAAVDLAVRRDLEMLAEPGEPVHVPDARLVGVVETLLAHLIAHDAPPPTEPSR